MAKQSTTTFTGAVEFSGTTNSGLKVNSLTTTQRNALTAANGMVIYNTTNGFFEKYEAGAWSEFTPDATFTTPGKVLQTVYNVVDYGAVGDGVTDDTAAIQEAVEAAQAVKGVAYAPRGIYSITGTGITLDASDITLVGDGVGSTTFLSNVGFGNTVFTFGNSGGPTQRSNMRFEGFDIDMNELRCWGMSVGWTKHITFRDMRISNPATNSFSMIFVGLFDNQDADWKANDITFERVRFEYGGVDNSWEAVTLGFCRNVKFIDCDLDDKPHVPGILTYNSEQITFTNTNIFNSSVQVSGRGPTTFTNCHFISSLLKIYAGDNVTFNGGSFYGQPEDLGSSEKLTGVAVQGNYFVEFGPECPFYLEDEAFPYTWRCKSIVFNGTTFKNCNPSFISAAETTVGTVGGDVYLLSASDVTLNACVLDGAYWDGVKLAADRLIITNNRVRNAGISLSGSTRQNFMLAALFGEFSGNQSFDDQDTPSVERDIVLSNEYVGSYLPEQVWNIGLNDLEVVGVFWYFNSGFGTSKPSEITINAIPDGASFMDLTTAQTAAGLKKFSASLQVSSDNTYFGVDDNSIPRLGLVKKSGADPFLALSSSSDFKLRKSSTADITPGSTYTDLFTVNGSGKGTFIGGVEVTAGESLLAAASYSDPAPAQSYDLKLGGNTNGLAVRGASLFNSAITLADSNIVLGTTTGTKFGTATSQKLAFYNSTPIVQPTGDIITALQNLGLVASATISVATVTSTLPIANGGTGSATQNFVDLTTGQTIAGLKKFSSSLQVNSDNTYFGVDDASTPRLGLVKKAGGDPFLALANGSTFRLKKSSTSDITPGSTYTDLLSIDGNGQGTFTGGVVATTGESSFAAASYSDPSPGNSYDLKLGGNAGGLAVRGASLFNSTITLADAAQIALGTSTGTKIGTATSQKLGFWNATPVVQPGATTDLGTVLSDIGARAAGTAYPITTSGAVTLTGTIALSSITMDGTAAWSATHGRASSGAGNSLTVTAGGGQSGGTNIAGGDLVLSSGIATGTNRSRIFLQVPTTGGSGSTDRTPATQVAIFSPIAAGAVVAVGNVGASTTGLALTGNVFALGGNSAGGLYTYRHNTSNTAGNTTTIQSGGATSGATDKAAGDLVLQTGLSTGTGGANVKIQTMTRALSTGTSDNTATDRIIVTSPKSITDGSATTLLSLALAAGSTIGGILRYTIEVTNGTDYQVETGQVIVSGYNKAGAFGVTATEVNSQQNVSSGTLTTAWAISSANPAVLSVNADTSLSASTGYPRITYTYENYGQQAVTVA